MFCSLTSTTSLLLSAEKVNFVAWSVEISTPSMPKNYSPQPWHTKLQKQLKSTACEGIARWSPRMTTVLEFEGMQISLIYERNTSSQNSISRVASAVDIIDQLSTAF